jgi:glutamyl-tRNA synthetase
MSKIKTRFAPSPTGYLHIGGLRTALFNFLFARQNKGNFILRIEDTDQERLVTGAEEKLINTLQNINLKPDGKIIKQSDRLKTYQAIAEELVNKKLAYKCYCSTERLDKLRKEQQANKQVPKYDNHCRDLDKTEGDKFVIRFKIPENKIIEVEDSVHGKISVKSEDLDDFVIIKSDGFPTYHLANVIDDYDMNISHVIRGEEWLPSLPKHKLLYDALEYKLPTFIHLPLLLNPDKSKLSKRQGDVAVEDFLSKGYLPQALLNYVALLGWNPGNDQELFSLEELIKAFDTKQINKAGAVFDLQKLNWFNAEYIRNIIKSGGDDYKNLVKLTSDFVENKTEEVLKLFGTRINNLEELKELSSFLWQLPEYPGKLLVFKKSDETKTKLGLTSAYQVLEAIEDWTQENLNMTLAKVVEKHELSPGDVFWPIRVAVSGLEQSPSPTEILEFLGKDESLKRIKSAIEKL